MKCNVDQSLIKVNTAIQQYYYRKQLFEMISLITITYDDLGLNKLDIKGNTSIVVLYNMVCFVVDIELYHCLHSGMS